MENLFRELMLNDNFRREFLEAKTSQEAYNLAKPYIDKMDLAEFEETIIKIAKSDGALSSEELASISAGGMTFYEAMQEIKSTFEVGMPLLEKALKEQDLK